MQYRIVEYLKLRHFIVIDCDVMDGIKYITFSKKQIMLDPYKSNNQRFVFIAHHKKMGYIKGQPDLIAMKDGKVYCLELKTSEGKQSKEQKAYQEMCERNNIPYIIVRDLEDLRGL